jgi:hypothetical protein
MISDSSGIGEDGPFVSFEGSYYAVAQMSFTYSRTNKHFLVMTVLSLYQHFSMIQFFKGPFSITLALAEDQGMPWR